MIAALTVGFCALAMFCGLLTWRVVDLLDSVERLEDDARPRRAGARLRTDG
jgi:hypothetical protein